MKEIEYIESVYNKYLMKHQQELVNELMLSIENNHKKFDPYKRNPKHYIISIYDPLVLHYVLLGKTNLEIHIEFLDEQTINRDLVSRFNLDEKNGDSILDPKVIRLKREIEYYFLHKSLKDVQSTIGHEIQLYITQHVTEVSYDISKMRNIESEYLWENLEK